MPGRRRLQSYSAIRGISKRGSLASAQTKINNLQVLRAFAALAVVFFHTGFVFKPLDPVGSFGVDVFFVLSGYIMARICEKNPQFFLRRRLIRIVPPYWMLTILLFLFALKFPELLSSTGAQFSELVKSLFFVPFFKSPGVIRPVLFVGWSLNYEMFFYLVLWLGLLLKPRRALLLSSIVVIAAHYGAILLHGHGAFSAFFSESFILNFPLGILCYEAARRVPEQKARSWRWASVCVLLGCIAGLVYLQLIRPHVGHALEGALYNTLCTLLVFATSLLSQGGWDTRWAPAILIGDASYVLYLTHPYCEYFLQRVMRLHIDRPLGCLLAVAISVAVGIVLHIYAERPLLNVLNERFGGHRKSAEFRVLAEPEGQVNP